MCIAEILSMMGAFAFPSLLPKFFSEWHLTNTEAGWINGVYFAGYTVAVPVLAGLTDPFGWPRDLSDIRRGQRRGHLWFRLLGQRFLERLVFSALFVVWGLAGTFIPGLKALVDRLDGSVQARAVAFYTANFSMGLSLSFFASGRIEALWGWRWAFIVAAAGTLLALPLAAIVLRPLPPRPVKKQTEFFLDFRPILRNRTAMAYILAYTAHMWELFAFRSWFVAFLAFSLSLDSSGLGHWQPSSVAAVSGLIAMWANIAGSELAPQVRPVESPDPDHGRIGGFRLYSGIHRRNVLHRGLDLVRFLLFLCSRRLGHPPHRGGPGRRSPNAGAPPWLSNP